MTLSRRALCAALLALGALPAGCASPSPTLYTLDAVPGVTHAGGPRIVILQDVGLAPYLDRKPIVRSTSDYHIAVETNAWWGETLSAMIGRVLVTELDQRLPGTQVFAESSTVSPAADATVALTVTRFETDAAGSVVLVADLGITFAGGMRAPITDTLRVTAQPSGTGVAGQVAGMSAALGRLADLLTADLGR